MTQKSLLRLYLILALVFLSLGGWLLHLRIHPVAKDAENWIPAVAGVVSVVVIPLLCCFRATFPFGYLLNGMTVIVVTITMAAFSLEKPPEVWSLKTLLFGTLLADIVLLWGKFAVGQALYAVDRVVAQPEAGLPTGRFWRYPNLGFWLAHLVAMSAIYAAGKWLWD
jgi:hypothetical protein